MSKDFQCEGSCSDLANFQPVYDLVDSVTVILKGKMDAIAVSHFNKRLADDS